MDSRFVPRSGAPHYIGEPGARADNRDGTLRSFPTSVDGTVDECTTVEYLTTGEHWYFDGDGWKRRMTDGDRVMNAVNDMRKQLSADNERLIAVMTEMRDLLLKIA